MSAMIFRFRMLSDENDHFVREYEVPYDMSLLDFHKFINHSLRYDDDGMVSFFTADQQWNRLREFTLMDMGDNAEEGPTTMAEMTHEEKNLISHRGRALREFARILKEYCHADK